MDSRCRHANARRVATTQRGVLQLCDSRPLHVLQADPSLGDALAPDRFSAARAEIIAASALLEPSGEDAVWMPDGPPTGFGLMVVSGLLVRRVVIGERCRSELVGPGDVVRPWDSDTAGQLPADASVRWRVSSPTRVAVLDQRLLESASSWPEITGALLTRVARRAQSLSVLLAVSCANRVEDRVALVLWHLANRWGRVTPRGVRLELPLTHELLAELVGARRPTVTSALARLSDTKTVVRDGPRAWLLPGLTQRGGFGHRLAAPAA